MARNKKDGKIFNCYLSTEIFDLLEDYSIKSGLTKTIIAERAIKKYLRSLERDNNDKTSDVAPLKQAEDAIYIDTTNLTIDEVVEKISEIIRSKLND